MKTKKFLSPYKFIKDNLLLTKTGACWAYYEIPPVTIEDYDVDKKETYKSRLNNLFRDLSKFPDFHLQLVPQELKLEECFGIIEKSYDPEYLEIARKYKGRLLTSLKEELGELTEYSFIIGVRLKSQILSEEESFTKSARKAFEGISDNLLQQMNVEVEMTEEDFEHYQVSELEAYHLLGTLGCQRLSQEGLTYLVRSSYIRGQSVNYENEAKKTGRELTECVIDPRERAGVLKLTNEDSESYMSSIVITNTSEDLDGLELFDFVQSAFSFPIEFHIKGRKVAEKAIKRRIYFTRTRFKRTDAEMYQNEEEDDQIIRGKDRLNDLKNAVNNEKLPFYEWIAVFTVTGKTAKEAKQRASDVQQTLSNEGVQCSRPLADQMSLFYKFLHGNTLKVKEPFWLQMTTNEALAEFSLGITHRLGSEIKDGAEYVGRLTQGTYNDFIEALEDSRNLVLYNIFKAHEGIQGASTDSVASLFTGETGKGKTFLVSLLFFYMMFGDIQILRTDPKKEVRDQYMKVRNDPVIQQNYPEFVELIDRINFVTLDADVEENHGALDPLNFLTGIQAKDTVMDIFSSMFPVADQRIENELRRVVDKVIKEREAGQAVGLYRIIDLLEANDDEDIKTYGENIRLKVDGSVLQLIFNKGTTKGMRIDEKVTVLEISGLDFPEAGTPESELTESQRKAVAIMMSLSKFCEVFGMRDRKKKTSIIFDEAWMLANAKGGNKLIKALRRVGRSCSNQLILVTQSVTDAERDDDTGNFGTYFCFQKSGEEEAILKTLGIPKTEENIKMLKEMKKGQCLFKDYYGRVGQLTVDCLFPEWIEAFKTVDP